MLILSKRYTRTVDLLAGHLTLMGCTQTKKKSTWKNSWKEEIWSVLRLFPRLPLLASVGDTMLN